MELSIVIPIYNEEGNLPELHDRLCKAANEIGKPFELIFVNDGSRDNSLLELIQLSKTHPSTKYINLSRNFGHQIAVCAGLDHAKGKAVAIIDGDLQDPPELIAEMYQKWQEGFQVVYAKRKERKGDSWFKKTTAKLFYTILKSLTQIDIPVDTGDFRLMDRQIVEDLKQMPEQNKFLRGQIAWLGYKQTAVLFDRDKRKHGKTGYSIGKMTSLAIDGITGFSDKPLQYVTRLGFVISLFSLIVIIYALYAHFVLHRTIEGWSSIIISTMFIGGVQLLSIGVIGAYISRMNKNIRNRPLYLIESDTLDK